MPCDAVVLEGRSHVDAARLTGEAVPVTREPRACADERQPQSGRAPHGSGLGPGAREPVRPDRRARPNCAGEQGADPTSGRPVRRLVHPAHAAGLRWPRTCCPAIRSACWRYWWSPRRVRSSSRRRWRSSAGINRAARRGIIFRHGTALEQLGAGHGGGLRQDRHAHHRTAARSPGCWRRGRSRRSEVLCGWRGRWSTAPATCSPARSWRKRSRAASLPVGREITEVPGEGVSGEVDGRRVTVGGWSFVVRSPPRGGSRPQSRAGRAAGGRASRLCRRRRARRGGRRVCRPDPPGVAAFLTALRRLGVRRTLLLSGDDQANASAVGLAVGIDEAHGGLLPAQKVAFVQRLIAGG